MENWLERLQIIVIIIIILWAVSGVAHLFVQLSAWLLQ